MGWIARLFGREKRANAPADHVEEIGAPEDMLYRKPSEESGVTYGLALAPVLAELQRINERLDIALAMSSSSHSGEGGTANAETMQRVIEYALAHFFGLLKGRGVGVTVPAAMLGQTPDGNTILPFDPRVQYILLVMNPLYPQLYSAQMILPSTFTRVDQLRLLPNDVQTKALHINIKKAPPGFIEAVRALQENNADNLYLGQMEASQDGSPHKLQYFPCTGSNLRNPAPERFPDDLVLFFHTQPRPIVVQQYVPNLDEVFAPLHELENGTPDWLAKDEKLTT